MNKRDVFEKYSSILTNINGNLLLRDSEAAGSVAVFGANPLTESALSTYDIPNGKSLGNDGSEFYTPDNIHYYDYGNFQSEYSMNSEYLNVLRLDGSQIVNDRLSMPSGINRIKSMVATGDNE